MPASPIRETIDLIPTEDAVQDTLNFVMANVRANLRRPLDVAEEIYGGHKKRHARSILTGALALSYGLHNLDHTVILNSLRSIDRCHAEDHEAMAECWQRIEDIAREMARECREYQGDEA